MTSSKQISVSREVKYSEKTFEFVVLECWQSFRILIRLRPIPLPVWWSGASRQENMEASCRRGAGGAGRPHSIWDAGLNAMSVWLGLYASQASPLFMYSCKPCNYTIRQLSQINGARGCWGHSSKLLIDNIDMTAQVLTKRSDRPR